MPLDDLIASGPKSLRPTLWVLSFVIAVTAAAIFADSALQSRIAKASVPLAERVSKLESGQETIGGKLDAILSELANTRTDVAVLGQKVDDGKRR